MGFPFWSFDLLKGDEWKPTTIYCHLPAIWSFTGVSAENAILDENQPTGILNAPLEEP